MSDPRIAAALEAHYNLIAPAHVARQNVDFEPPAPEVEYEEIFIIPGPPRAVGLRQRTVIYGGIFQISLCYPANTGAGRAEARGKLISEHFDPETTVLTGAEGVQVRVVGPPAVGAPIPGKPGRYVIPVSVRYSSVIS